MHATVHEAANRAGVAIVRTPPPHTLGWALRRVIATYGVDHVLDVGAHRGEFARRLRDKARFTGSITSFEPSPETYAALTAALGHDPAWRGCNLALGAQDGDAELRVHSASDFDSLHDLNAAGHDRFPELSVDGTRTVPVRRLDRVIGELGIDGSTSRVLLKTDTQGHDLDVIRGAGSALEQIAAVLMETAAIPIYDGVATIDVAVAEMRDRGFDPAGFFPVISERNSLPVMEFDALFVNRLLDAGRRASTPG